MRFRLSAASLCSALLVIAMADGPTAVDAAVVNVQLDMPPRLQWPQSGGYCGETSLQMSGLYFGAWISQFVAREKGGGDQEEGQLLLPYSSSDNIDEGGRNLFKAAVALGFSVNAFPSRQRQQSRKLLQWARKQLIAKKPVIYGVFVADCGGARDCDQDYDHIVPATGYIGTSSGSYNVADRLLSYNLFSTERMDRPFSSMAAAPTTPVSSTSCKKDLLQGGNIPLGMNYAVAINGFRDPGKAGKPIRLAVDQNREPNVADGEPAGVLTGTVTVSSLKKGKMYRLMRYDSVAKVPVSGNKAAWLTSKFDSKVEFTATATTWTYKDPRKIVSSGVAYYKCVQMN